MRTGGRGPDNPNTRIKHIIQKLHLNKRIKTGENYAETITITTSENVGTLSTAIGRYC